MNSDRKTARNVGILFLIAMFTSLLGGGLIESVITSPDNLVDLASNGNLLYIGVFLELINGIAVIGIVALLFPILKTYNQSITLGFAGFRIIEAIFCFVAALLPLFFLSTGQESVQTGSFNASGLQTMGTVLTQTRAQMAGLWIPLFFGLGALFFYVLVFHYKLLPRFIPIWGFIGVAMILALNLLDIETGIGMLLALPIILNEIFLGIWLIVKGLNVQS